MVGSLCISIDVELGWGIWDKPNDDYYRRCAEREERIVRGLLEMFVARDISATWAIVGRLLERDERAINATKYGARIWYAPELVDLVRDAPVSQDIGSHSYAHVYFGEATRDTLRDDLQAARRVHEQHGLPFISFVYPRNQVAQLDLLHDAGIRVFRSVDQGWYMTMRDKVGTNAGRIANLVDKVLPLPPRTVAPRRVGVLVELPSSMLLFSRKGLRRAIHPRVLLAKARLGMEAASRNGEIFHLWFHPSNFYHDTERQLEVLEDVLDTAATLRKSGRLVIKPMSAFATQ
jgi:peptidoglycan/xylan/chitin deacetylase (PgdA/CDA1 family)